MTSPNPKRLEQSPPHPLSSVAFPPCGLLSLPVESPLEILSYFPAISPPRANGAYDPSVKSIRYTRPDALCVIFQTCRALRRTFLQQRWERLDVYTRECRRWQSTDEQVSKGLVWYKQVSKPGAGASRGTSSLPRTCGAYAPTPRTVPGLTPRRQNMPRRPHALLTKTTLPVFMRCLPLLTNLHTLEILHASSQMTTTLQNAFAGHTFPAIRTVVLPSCATTSSRPAPRSAS